MGNDWGKHGKTLFWLKKNITSILKWRKTPPTPIVLLGKCIGSWDVCCFLGQGAVKNNKRTTAQHCASQSCQLAHQKTKNAPELFKKKSRFTVFVLT